MAAHLESQESLTRLRQALLLFIDRAGGAVDGACRSLQNGHAWLRDEQIPRAESEHRRREIRLGEAKLAYNSARLSVRMEQKASFEEEEREYRTVLAAYERSEACLQRNRAWLRHLEKEGKALITPIRQMGRRIEDMRDQAVAELDRKIREVAAYLGHEGGQGS